MDKVEMKYRGVINDLYTYELRIPENLDWFVISRYSNKENSDFDAEYLIYNGNIIFAGYSHEGNEKIKKFYNENEEEEIKKEFAYDLLQNAGINLITLQILDRLQFEVKHIKRKYWYHYWFNHNIKYVLKENLSDDEDYEEFYDILFNGAVLGKFYADNGNLKVEINLGNQVDILQLSKAKTYESKNNKYFSFTKKLTNNHN